VLEEEQTEQEDIETKQKFHAKDGNAEDKTG